MSATSPKPSDTKTRSSSPKPGTSKQSPPVSDDPDDSEGSDDGASDDGDGSKKKKDNKKSDPKQYFRVPKSNQSPATKLDHQDYKRFGPYDGFLSIEGSFLVIKIHAPTDGMIWHVERKLTVVLREGEARRKIVDSQKEPTYKLPLYRGYFNKDEKKDDGLRFIFTGIHARSPTKDNFAGHYMLSDVLERRLQGYQSDYNADYDNFTFESAPYPLWLPSGELLPVKTRYGILAIFAAICGDFNSGGGRPKRNPGKDDAEASRKRRATDDKKYEKMFEFYCEIARVGSLTSSSFSSGLALFKNYEAKEEAKLELVVPKIHGDKLKAYGVKLKKRLDAKTPEYNQLPNDTDSADEGARKTVTYLVSKLGSYKPVLTVRVSDTYSTGHEILSQHPNQLFTLTYNAKEYSDIFTNAKYGVGDKDRAYPDLDKAQTANEKMFNEKVPTTSKKDIDSKPTKERVAAASRRPRGKTQNSLMGNKGAAEIVSPWWGTGEKQLEVAQWLHRSAWSYGGLHENGVNKPPESSQSSYNLIIGTFETNYVMLRYEQFVKRFLNNYIATRLPGTRRKEHAKFSIKTRDKYPEGKEYNWMKDFIWLCPMLEYKYDTVTPVAGCHGLVDFHTFRRRTCRRYEAELDIALEKIIYDWSRVF